MSKLTDYKIKKELEFDTEWAVSTIYSISGVRSFMVNSNPFGNCQSFAIGYFCNLITRVPAKELIHIIREIRDDAGAGKSLLIVDLNENYFDSVSKYLDIMESTPYESSNGSAMVQCIIDTRE